MKQVVLSNHAKLRKMQRAIELPGEHELRKLIMEDYRSKRMSGTKSKRAKCMVVWNNITRIVYSVTNSRVVVVSLIPQGRSALL